MGLSFCLMFFILSKVLLFLIQPLTWIILLLLGSFLFRNPRWKHAMRLASLGMLLIFTNPLLSHWAMRKLESPPTSSITPHSVGIVLSGMMVGGIDVHDQIQLNESAERLTEATKLYREGLIKKILISGGAADINYPMQNEGSELYSLAMALGIPQKDLISESNSRNTYENAVNVRSAVSNESLPFLLITSAFHMHRAKGCFVKQGIAVTPYPVDYRVPSDFKWSYLVPSASALSNWNTVLKELVGLAVYQIKGYI
jgi:uncharacterized SAM-binding protein YcdF (DUF218 family)